MGSEGGFQSAIFVSQVQRGTRMELWAVECMRRARAISTSERSELGQLPRSAGFFSLKMHFLSEAFRPSEESARSERSASLLALPSPGLKASLRKCAFIATHFMRQARFTLSLIHI